MPHRMLKFIPPPPPRDADVFQMGTVLGAGVPFFLAASFLKVHMAVLGESGGGKSKFLELFVRFLLLLREGGMLVDPANDLVDAVMAFVARRTAMGDDLLRRIHYLTISKHLAFRYDPFADLPPRASVTPVVYENALRVKADRLFKQIMRRVAAADVDVMNRLKKRLKAALTACAVDYDGRGRYLGLGKLTTLTDPNDREFRLLLDLVFPHLPRSQQNAYREILGDKVPAAAKERWDSTMNRVDEVMSPFVALALTRGPSIDVKKAVLNREFIVCRMGQTPDWSYDQAVTMGGILIDALLEVKEAEENAPPYLRAPTTLIVDELGDYIGEDIILALRNDRKFLLRCVVGAQNTATLVRGNVDMAPFILSLCQTIVCFAQKLRVDKELIADRMFTGNMGLTKRYVEVQRQRGFIHLKQEEHSHGDTRTHTEGEMETATDSNAQSKGRGRGASWADNQGESIQHLPDNPLRTTSGGRARGGSDIETATQVDGHALSVGKNRSLSTGTSHTVSFKTAILPNLVSEFEWNGQYEEGSPTDQEALHRRWLHLLRSAECFVTVYGHPYAFPVRIETVAPMWATPQAEWQATEEIKRRVAAQWEYTFTPGGDLSALPPEAVHPDAVVEPDAPEENAFGN